MECTTQALQQSNVTAVFTALDLWDRALSVDNDDKNMENNATTNRIPDPIRVTALQLQASCLVRTGQDERAVAVLDQALTLVASTDTTCSDKLRMHRQKGQSLQRLLRYRQAKQEYRQAQAIVEAATCDLRLGDWKAAMETLAGTATTMAENNNNSDNSEATILLEMLRYLTHSSDYSPERLRRTLSLFRGEEEGATTALVSSPLHKWFYVSTTATAGTGGMIRSNWATVAPFIEYCRANVGAWDDPLLVLLDDKVWLHQLLMGRAWTTTTQEEVDAATNSSCSIRQFWPFGMILSSDAYSKLLNDVDDDNSDKDEEPRARIPWIAKRRSGYGSHGNTLVRTSVEQARELMNVDEVTATTCLTDNNCILLQQMVEPPLLVQGRKFSLRVYVVYFLGGDENNDRSSSTTLAPEVYVSTKGLVKVAALPFLDVKKAKAGSNADDADNPRCHMTNSGREAEMQQETFDFLRTELSSSSSGREHPFDDHIWPSVQRAIRSVMQTYQQYAAQQHGQQSHDSDGIIEASSDLIMTTNRGRLGQLGLPKILGFDFVVDAARNAWLVEVNRFPGLEPRDGGDAVVKQQVVRDAWALAAARRSDPQQREMLLSWLSQDFAHFQFVQDHDENALEQLLL